MRIDLNRLLFVGTYEHFERVDILAVFKHFEVKVRSVETFAALSRGHFAEQLTVLYGCSDFESAVLSSERYFVT